MQFSPSSRQAKLVSSTLVSLVALLLFVAKPIFAQTTSTPLPSPNTTGISEPEGNNSDFDDDVKQGKDELKKDTEAQKLQKEVVDGEDEQAGDEKDEDINEHSDIQEAENAQGENEENEDINNSEVEEVDDADNLNGQSQEVINEHEHEEELEIEQEKQSEINEGASSSDEENPSQEQAPTDTDGGQGTEQ